MEMQILVEGTNCNQRKIILLMSFEPINCVYIIESSSGIQVITLGILTGLSIIIFYGLAIFFSIRRKKQ